MHSQPIMPRELVVLHFLRKRMRLPQEAQVVFSSQLKGYKGERKFAQLLNENLNGDVIILHSLLLEGYDRSEFQLDCLVLFREEIYLFEFKNYEGNVFYQDKEFYYVHSREKMKNPLLQLERATFLFTKLLGKLGSPFPIRSHVVFINESFTLFQAPMNLPMILPTQLKRLMEKLNRVPDSMTPRHRKLAENFSTLHKTKSDYERLPDYHFDMLDKGVMCKDCAGKMNFVVWRKLRCEACAYEEGFASAVMRSVVEFSILFPDMLITVGIVQYWCALEVTDKVMRELLKKYMKLNHQGNKSYYTFNCVQLEK